MNVAVNGPIYDGKCWSCDKDGEPGRVVGVRIVGDEHQAGMDLCCSCASALAAKLQRRLADLGAAAE